MTVAAGRQTSLDVLRGLAVLIMIEAHVLDSWTRTIDRANPWFGRSLILGGFGAPLFLFLAGVAVSLSAGSKSRSTGDQRAAASAVQKRGLEIFGLAFLFRLQAFLISQSSARALLKVDILNIMGPAIVGTAWLWGALRSLRTRLIAFGGVTALIAFSTPPVRALSWLAALPDFVEGYIRPIPGITNFAIFPWAAFVPAGALVGILIDDARVRGRDREVNVRLGVGGLALTAGAFGASFLPPLDARSSFWTSSPSFFFMRVGLIVTAVAGAYFWEQRRTRLLDWSPLLVLGRSSLFIYWIHVEMVYGLISLPLHGALTFGQAWLALVAFSTVMLMAAVAKDHTVRWWKSPAGRGVWPKLGALR